MKEMHDIPQFVKLVQGSIDFYYSIGDDNMIEEYEPVFIDEKAKEIFPV